jgi:hypothetical protein
MSATPVIDRPAALPLCPACGLPDAIHFGYDHGRRRCIIARDWIDLRLRYSTDAEAKDVVRRVNAWYAARQADLEARNDLGAGI